MVDKSIATGKWAEDSWKTDKYACLNCGKEVDAASESPLEEQPRGPQKGDVTVCLYCSHLMIFTGDAATVRDPTDAEMDDIMSDPDVVTLLEAMAKGRSLWRRRHG